jgi:hypothetical protein
MLPPVEKFEEACWNGLLNEMFSELMPYNSSQFEKIFIWGIYAGKSYLLIDLGDAPGTIESLLSIDPHRGSCKGRWQRVCPRV